MRHEKASAAPRKTLRVGLSFLRLAGGVVSLFAAISFVVMLEPTISSDAEMRATVALLTLGLAAFAAALVWHGRDATREWLAFGARLGFLPASRRPVTAVGTDRPALFGRTGRHCARLRSGARPRKWLQAELDLVGVDPSWRASYVRGALVASEPRVAERMRPWLEGLESLELRDGTLVLRARDQGLAVAPARLLLEDAARLADELQKPL